MESVDSHKRWWLQKGRPSQRIRAVEIGLGMAEIHAAATVGGYPFTDWEVWTAPVRAVNIVSLTWQ